MALRILHSSDWHLGHTLHGVSRSYEHRSFLTHLLTVLKEREVDALLVTGDVFDTANPSAEAQALYYEFLSQALRDCSGLDIVIVAGNHDSASRLEAPRPLLEALGARVVGTLPRGSEGEVLWERVLVPLHGSSGDCEALCVALPYLRPADLRLSDLRPGDGARGEDASTADPWIEAMRDLHRDALEAAICQRSEAQALLLTGHCYMSGSVLSELSERRIFGGNLHALPADLFGEAWTYVALGHLHKAQRVGGRDSVRYAGSPLPLSFAECSYRHQLRLIEIEGGELVSQEALLLPRVVELLRLGPLEESELEERIAQLEGIREDEPEVERPMLELRVTLQGPRPGLRGEVAELLREKRPRLLRLGIETSAVSAEDEEEAIAPELDQLDPRQVLELRWKQDFEGEMPEELLRCYAELLEVAQRGEGRA